MAEHTTQGEWRPASEFGSQLRATRKQLGLSQRRLAGLTGLDFTYLSKIETGAVPPPGDEAILKLAGVLAADVDALFLLARRVPPDITELLSGESVSFVKSLRIEMRQRS